MLLCIADRCGQKSLETLKQYQIYGLDLRNWITEECLIFHNGQDTNKDIALLEEIRLIFQPPCRRKAHAII